MSKTIAVIIAIFVIITGFVIAIKFDLFPKQQYGPYDNFIICLKASGARFYGNYANADSLRQMSFFGDSLPILERSGIYLECNSRGPNPQVKKCQDNGIKIYPTWIIEEKQYPGIMGLNKLEELTGCKREN